MLDMPSLSPTMSHGNILEWKKKVRGRYGAWISEGMQEAVHDT